MRTVIILYLIFGWISVCKCQETDTIYYDRDWKITAPKRYKYYRVVKEYKNIFKVVDYYRSGKIQMTGGYKSANFGHETGPFFYYDKKKRLIGFEFYESSLYPEFQSGIINISLNVPSNDSLVLYGSYSKNGNIRSMGYGRDGCFRQGTWYFFYKDGSLNATNTYANNQLHGDYILYLKSGKIFCKGSFKDNKEDGAKEYYTFEGKLKKTLFYSNGKLIKKVREPIE